jgi:hypothetical protein
MDIEWNDPDLISADQRRGQITGAVCQYFDHNILLTFNETSAAGEQLTLPGANDTTYKCKD